MSGWYWAGAALTTLSSLLFIYKSSVEKTDGVSVVAATVVNAGIIFLLAYAAVML